jgi:hypothetical protein
MEYMQVHPDVVCCSSAPKILDIEAAGTDTVLPIPSLAPERPWSEARHEFFTWPQNNASYAIYGVFRRDVLTRCLDAEIRRQRRQQIVWWVTLIMARVSLHGRIVALPQPLRAYRLTKGSESERLRRQLSPRQLSPYDYLIYGLRVKALLLNWALLGRLAEAGTHRAGQLLPGQLPAPLGLRPARRRA